VTARSLILPQSPLQIERVAKIYNVRFGEGASLYPSTARSLNLNTFSLSKRDDGIPFHAGERYLWTTVCLILLAFAVTGSSAAQTLTTLVNFNESNGADPYFVVQGRDGGLLGTTFGMGSTYCGTAFGLSPAGAFRTVTMSCNPNFPDGNEPQGLIQGTDGNLYGVTFFGGTNEEGSVYN